MVVELLDLVLLLRVGMFLSIAFFSEGSKIDFATSITIWGVFLSVVEHAESRSAAIMSAVLS